MRRLIQQQSRVLVGLFVMGLASFFSPGPAWAQLPTPNQAILVVQNSSATDPYQNFVPELLTTEGLNGFQTAQLPTLTASFLANYDVVILPHLSLTAAQAALFGNYVNAGGTLIGFRPDPQLATVFGVNVQGATVPEAWLKINTTTPYGAGLVSQALRFHGTADAYSLLTATSLATLYTDPDTATAFPAAAVNTYGSGTAVLFSFDLTQSIVLLRQGNPAWAGYPNTHDGNNTLRSSQMFMDAPSGQFWNDKGDNGLSDIPQADEQMRLFSNAITLTNAAKRPLPRLWYYPKQAPALVLMTGDHHGDPSSNSSAESSAVQAAGGAFQEYLWMDPVGAITPSSVQSWQSQGNSFGVHFDDTAQVDASGVGGSAANWAGMNSVMSAALGALPSAFPTVSNPPISNRNHFLIWISQDSTGGPDQTAQAELFQNYGIKMDSTFSAFPSRWGYMNGSGLPMKFLSTTTGNVIPVYEQGTEYEDDVQLSNEAYSLDWDLATAQTHYQKSISDSLTKYNTVIQFLFHPDHWNTLDSSGNGNYQTYAATALSYAKANNVPIVTVDSWATFWAARAATTVSEPTFSSGTLSFTVTGAPANLSLLIPDQSAARVISGVNVDGTSSSFTVVTLQGVTYASVVVTSGSHSVTATYGTAGTISGTISPSAAAASTSIQIQSGSITQAVIPAANGTYTTGPFPAGTYTVTPSSSAYTFSPTSRSVALSTSNVTGVNFAYTTNAPGGETIFTTQIPAIPSSSDGAGVNYELGTSFTSDVAGQITAIRFWKSSSETGTHTGHIWSSTGTQLASATFTNETASGWQQMNLATPLAITANTTYVVSVNTGNSFFVDTVNGLAVPVINQDLSTVNGNNGVFGTPGAFPTSVHSASNYFRDIVMLAYSASGTVSPAANGSGVTLTLSGSGNATATADSSGNYVFSGLIPGGSYTITPSMTDFTFTPANLSFTVGSGSVTGLNFTAAPITFAVSGTISGTGGNGATVTLSSNGTTVATTTASASGVYGFSGVLDGSYTVTPSHAGYNFSPASSAVTVASAGVANVNFSASEILFTTQTPVSNGLTDGSTINYELGTLFQSGVAGQITGIRFWKDSHESGTHTGHIWSASGTLLATVTFGNETASGWQVQNLATPLVIAANTTYVVSVNTGNSYYVASASGLASKITNLDLSSVVGSDGVYGSPGAFPTGSYQNSNYFRDVTFLAGSVPTYAVSGTIAGVSGATVTLSGSGSTVATTTYTFSSVANGSYTVTPSLAGYTFTPPSASVTVSGANVTGINFTAATATTETLFTTQTPSAAGLTDGPNINYELGTVFQSDISGQITGIRFWKDSHESGTHTGHIWSASGTLLATVTFSNETASGWQVQNLTTPLAVAASTSYVVSVNTGNAYYAATANGLTSQIINLDLSSVVGSNGVYASAGVFPTGSYQNTDYFRDVVFLKQSGAVPTYSISGTTDAAGASVTLAANGSTAATITADGSGSYTFSNVPNGTYTVTPSLASYTFTPTSASVTVNGANVNGINFTASTVTTQTLFTSQTPATTGLTDGANANYELGTLVRSDIAGQIMGIRFWKDPHESGTHTGHIWSASGTLLATVTFSNETASGWQVQNLATPLAIVANTTYVVSVNTGNSYYVASASGLASKITNQDLSSVVGSNGVYGSPGAFPTSSYQSTNYFRDVTFLPGSVPTYTISGTITGASGATVTLSASGSTVATISAGASGTTYTFSSVANGSYTVTPSLAGYAFTPQNASVTVNGANVTSVNFTAATATTETLFSTQTPTATGLTDGANVNYELGTLVQSDIAGQITGIRFWKDALESGTHTGHIWSASGTLLATVTFTNETASGWQVQNLTTPLAIAANTTYVVSVNSGNTYYVATDSGLASKIINQDLSSVVGSNGVYASVGVFPTGSYHNTNYFRDVVFTH